MGSRSLAIAVLSIHSSPVGKLGTRHTGGMSVYIRELARVLGSRGHRVDIFTRLQDPSGERETRLSENVRLIRVAAGNAEPMPTLAIYPYLGDFCREVEKFKTRHRLHYDLIHSHYWLSGLVGKKLESLWNSPHMVMFHTLGVVKNLTVRDERESELRIAAEKELVRDCQRILAATVREREHLCSYCGVRPERVAVVPCGVDLDLFQPVDGPMVRRELGVRDEEAMALFVGRLSPVKGVDRLLNAMPLINGSRPVRLVVIGGDDQASPELLHLEKLTRDLGLQDKVVFAGRKEHRELPPYFCAADVVVLPSRYETFGLVALEALACGTPVVATRVGAMETLLNHGENGQLVENGDPQLLAEGIRRFIGSSGSGGVPAHVIRGSVLKYGWEAVASAVLDEYETMLGQYKRAGFLDRCEDDDGV